MKGALRSLDDAQLLELHERLEAYRDRAVWEHVETFAEHYLQQVAPIGIERPDSLSLFTDDGTLRGDKRAVGRAVNIVLPGGRVRLALVDELTDKHPELRQGERAIRVGMQRMFSADDDPLVHGSMVRAQQDQWIVDPAVELHFLRWIDDPRMAVMAAPEAATVPAERVIGLPPAALFDTALAQAR